MLFGSGISNLAQENAASEFENKFFRLDFENNDIKMENFKEFFFTTFPHDDPTEGDVVYDRVQWKNSDMISLKEDGLRGYIKYRDDNSSYDSFRFTSKPYYNLNSGVKKILFVFKGKFPSEKGVWPAWWLNGSRQSEWLYEGEEKIDDELVDKYSGKGRYYETPSPVNCTDWPAAGEVDIIETINGDNIIHNTIHTCPQMCDSEWNNNGEIINCANGNETDPNAGCSGEPYEVESPEGTFACLWDANSISFYYWKTDEEVRNSGGPLSTQPDPESWNKSNLKNRVEFLNTNAGCDETVHQDWQCSSCEGYNECKFVNLKMVFNITLCGKWAGRKFDETENTLNNCKNYITSEGVEYIDDKYFKIEFVSASEIK
ncbi:MAG: hypothetical protein SCALA702_14180 [Melioribacteraceae bacterium]|nr:MAG: hypothetical protein SCALA702_14180 [Melioribacteraceae bacterium]